MDIVPIAAILLAGFVLFLAISSWRSRSRDSTDPFHYNRDHSSHAGYLGADGERTLDRNDGGDWGGRDMSHDSHAHVDSGGGDWSGGDAGGDSGGGGGE